jgi:hypothetical protein
MILLIADLEKAREKRMQGELCQGDMASTGESQSAHFSSVNSAWIRPWRP